MLSMRPVALESNHLTAMRRISMRTVALESNQLTAMRRII